MTAAGASRPRGSRPPGDERLRFVQFRPGSACSIVLGTWITRMPPGSAPTATPGHWNNCRRDRGTLSRSSLPNYTQPREGRSDHRRFGTGSCCATLCHWSKIITPFELT